jgi:hypothetical protein
MPWPNRNYAEWKQEVGQDVAAVLSFLRELDDVEATRESRVRSLAMARKEALRLVRDVERVGSEVFEIAKDEIDAVRT